MTDTQQRSNPAPGAERRRRLPRWNPSGALARCRAAWTGRRRAAARAARSADLAAQAKRQAEADVDAGMFDQWSFGNQTTLLHLQTLRRRRDWEIAETRRSLADEALAERKVHARRAADTAVLQRRLDLLQDLHEESQQFGRRAVARMDRLATREATRRRIFTLMLPRTSRREPSSAEETAELGRRHDDVETLAQLGMLPPTEAVPWAGPSTPPIGPLTRSLTMLGLVAVDLPVTFFVFLYFHGTERQAQMMTWLFAVPTAFAMVILPHFSGLILRNRQATGREWRSTWVATLLLVPWAFVAYHLGVLRGRLLTIPPADPETGESLNVPSLVDRLGVAPSTILTVFVALMLMTGGIGFLLGLAHPHPLQSAYANAVQAREKLERRLSRFRPIARTSPLRSTEEAREQETSAVQAIQAAYATAEHTYLETVGRRMADPAVTEAIIRLSDALATERERAGDGR